MTDQYNTSELTLTNSGNRTDRAGMPILKVVDPWWFQYARGRYFAVPEERETNLGTIPWFGRWFLSPIEIREASAMHDTACNERYGHDDNHVTRQDSGWSRWLADALIYEYLRRQAFHEPRKWRRRWMVFRAIVVWLSLRASATVHRNTAYRDPTVEES